MVETTHKRLKEEFVSNLTGGTITEINLVTAVAPAAYILFAALQTRLRLFERYGALQYMLDIFLNCFAILLATTLYSSQPALLNALLLSPAALLSLTTRPASPQPKPKPKAKSQPPGARADAAAAAAAAPAQLPKKPFLTVYRGAMMVITCGAILAVDFRVFPRRFAKVENWGTSLMDMGVGSFVFSGGLVAARTELKAAGAVPVAARLRTALRAAAPLLALGGVRLAMVKGVDYAEHVSEYGVHWNFFFTLGLLPPFVALLQAAAAPRRSPVLVYTALALAVAGAYQAALLGTGLQEFVLVGDRRAFGLLGMNKEGAASFWGYLAIFLAGMATGCYVLPADPRMLRKLLGWAAYWSLACAAVRAGGGKWEVSRRLANLSYVLWVAAFNTAQLAAFYCVERAFFGERGEYKDKVPRVLEAFNRNGLLVFLVANLLTGLVNISVHTLFVSTTQAMGILAAYMATLAAVALFLDWRDLSIKL